MSVCCLATYRHGFQLSRGSVRCPAESKDALEITHCHRSFREIPPRPERRVTTKLREQMVRETRANRTIHRVGDNAGGRPEICGRPPRVKERGPLNNTRLQKAGTVCGSKDDETEPSAINVPWQIHQAWTPIRGASLGLPRSSTRPISLFSSVRCHGRLLRGRRIYCNSRCGSRYRAGDGSRRETKQKA